MAEAAVLPGRRSGRCGRCPTSGQDERRPRRWPEQSLRRAAGAASDGARRCCGCSRDCADSGGGLEPGSPASSRRLPAGPRRVSRMVRETYAFALANAGQADGRDRQARGASGSIGADARTPRLASAGATSACSPMRRTRTRRNSSNRAINAYERGMELDLNQYYCSSNLPRLYPTAEARRRRGPRRYRRQGGSRRLRASRETERRG